MKNKRAKYIKARHCLIAVLLGSTLLYACSNGKKKHNTIIGDLELPSNGETIVDTTITKPFNGNYTLTFNDVHELHMKEASKNGFSPMATRRDTSRMKGKIVYYKPGIYENFVVDSLPHSMPVMIPQVATLIDIIGKEFRDALKIIDYPDTKIVITSITRTDEDIRDLKRRNQNAIDDSAHRFGTTFDISWMRYHLVDSLDKRTAYDRVLKKTLANVLHKMQQQGKCYIMHENQQMCFHITIRREK